MNRVFKTRHFIRWMKKTDLSDKSLCKAVEEMSQGLIDADIGGNVVKKRVAVAGQGKRGGVRTLLATNKNDRWFFLFGFQKNTRANITDKEKDALQHLAVDLLALTPEQLDAAVENKSLEEICDERQRKK